jgi:hypothetical protein
MPIMTHLLSRTAAAIVAACSLNLAFAQTPPQPADPWPRQITTRPAPTITSMTTHQGTYQAGMATSGSRIRL